MKTIFYFLLITLILSKLNALEIESQYEVTFGLFGKIGKASASLIIDNNSYKIDIKAHSSAIAKVLSNNRVESYESVGEVRDGVLIPHKFTKIVTQNHKGSSSIYTIDHKNRKVTREKEKYKIVKDFLSQKEMIEKSSSNEELEYYAKDDLLTLFFNLKHYIDSINKKSSSPFFAVGANASDGRVDILKLSRDEFLDFSAEELKQKSEKKSLHYLKVILNQKIFSSKKGELFIALDSDFLAKEALLKDVYIFGDIKGEMSKKEIREVF